MARYQSYIICTSPRSGSTLLCKLLAATGRSGTPNSHFHRPALASWLEAYDLKLAQTASEQDVLNAVFRAVRDAGTGDTGMFGLRLQRHSVDFFLQKLDILHPGLSSDIDRIQAAFGSTLLVYLSRANKLDQAISLIKATQSGLWHKAPDGTELERTGPAQDLVYDGDAIAREMAVAVALDDAWNAWFTAQGLDPVRISYDNLSAEPIRVLGDILKQLGLNPDITDGIQPQVAKLADATSLSWAHRFSAENRDV